MRSATPSASSGAWPLSLALTLTGGLFLVVMCLALFFLVWRSGISKDIARLERLARDAGYPLTLLELQVRHKPVAEGRNFFAAMIPIWEEEDPSYWKAVRDTDRVLPSPGDSRSGVPPKMPLLGRDAQQGSDQLPWNPDQQELVRGYLHSRHSRMERVRHALQLERAPFHLPGSGGFDERLPHLPLVKWESTELMLSGLLAASERKANALAEDVERITRLADCLREDPFLMSQLVRCAVLNRALQLIEAGLSQGALNEAQLKRMQDVLRSIDLSQALHTAFLGERVMALRIYHTPMKEFVPHDETSANTSSGLDRLTENMTVTRSPMNALGFFSLDQRLMMSTFQKLIELTKEGSWDRLLEVEAAITNAAAEASVFPPKPFAGLGLSMLETSSRRFLRLEALRRCTLLALDVELHRVSEARRLPESIEEVKGSASTTLLVDPFNGQPLRYKRSIRGYLIYSLGPDRKDQNGESSSSKTSPAADDIPLRVESP